MIASVHLRRLTVPCFSAVLASALWAVLLAWTLSAASPLPVFRVAITAEKQAAPGTPQGVVVARTRLIEMEAR